jgi:hypothetical protein
MYDYVKSLGYTIRRSQYQTDAGAGFWDKHKSGKNVWEQDKTQQRMTQMAAAKKPKKKIAEGYFDDFTFNVKRRKLNVPALINAGAIFVTYSHSEQGWDIRNKADWSYSLISLYNVESGGWTAEAKKYVKPGSYKHAEQSINSSKPNLGANDLVYDGKYNQILWSIEKLKLPDNVAFLDKEEVVK